MKSRLLIYDQVEFVAVAAFSIVLVFCLGFIAGVIVENRASADAVRQELREVRSFRGRCP